MEMYLKIGKYFDILLIAKVFVWDAQLHGVLLAIAFYWNCTSYFYNQLESLLFNLGEHNDIFRVVNWLDKRERESNIRRTLLIMRSQIPP